MEGENRVRHSRYRRYHKRRGESGQWKWTSKDHPRSEGAQWKVLGAIHSKLQTPSEICNEDQWNPKRRGRGNCEGRRRRVPGQYCETLTKERGRWMEAEQVCRTVD